MSRSMRNNTQKKSSQITATPDRDCPHLQSGRTLKCIKCVQKTMQCSQTGNMGGGDLHNFSSNYSFCSLMVRMLSGSSILIIPGFSYSIHQFFQISGGIFLDDPKKITTFQTKSSPWKIPTCGKKPKEYFLDAVQRLCHHLFLRITTSISCDLLQFLSFSYFNHPLLERDSEKHFFFLWFQPPRWALFWYLWESQWFCPIPVAVPHKDQTLGRVKLLLVEAERIFHSNLIPQSPRTGGQGVGGGSGWRGVHRLGNLFKFGQTMF